MENAANIEWIIEISNYIWVSMAFPKRKYCESKSFIQLKHYQFGRTIYLWSKSIHNVKCHKRFIDIHNNGQKIGLL